MLGDSIRRRRRAPSTGADRDEPKDGAARKRRGRAGRGRPADAPAIPVWLQWTGLALLVLVGTFALGYLLASQLLFPRPETAGVGVEVPSLYGMERPAAERALTAVGLRVGSVTGMPSLRVAAGRVVAQEPIPDQQLRPGAEVSLAVSTGPPEVRVPPVTGLGEQTARALLEAAGFDIEVRQVRSGGVAPGRVLRTEPGAGELLRLPASLTLIVNVGPEEVEPVDSPVVDTGPTAWP
jgi:beta-lactam-binding protein with PASTA domain